MEVAASPELVWASATLPRPGERGSGERCVVLPDDGGTLVALVDAHGHGQDAAWVAATCAEVISDHRREPLEEIVRRCHARLRTTAGAALALARFDPGRDRLGWLAVGNCTAALLRAHGTIPPWARPLLTRAGVVGEHLPELVASLVAVEPDDTLVMVSHGVRADFADPMMHAMPQALVDSILAQHARPDAGGMALAARYRGLAR